MPCECIDWGYSPDQGPRRYGHHPTCERGLAMTTGSRTFASHAERQKSAAANIEEANRYLKKALADLTDDGERIAFGDAVAEHLDELSGMAQRLREYARNNWI